MNLVTTSPVVPKPKALFISNSSGVLYIPSNFRELNLFAKCSLPMKWPIPFIMNSRLVIIAHPLTIFIINTTTYNPNSSRDRHTSMKRFINCVNTHINFRHHNQVDICWEATDIVIAKVCHIIWEYPIVVSPKKNPAPKYLFGNSQHFLATWCFFTLPSHFLI